MKKPVNSLTESKRIIREVKDGSWSNYANLSIVKDSDESVYLVIGAQWEHRNACCFHLTDLEQLVDALKEVAEVLREDSGYEENENYSSYF